MRDKNLGPATRTLVILTLGVALLVGLAPISAIAKPPPVTKITFKLADHNVPPGAPLIGSVHVRTRSNHEWVPFAGAPLTVRVGGVDVLTLTTDANGDAAISYVAAQGDHVMRVIFAGDDTHRRARRAQGFSVVVGATAVPAAPVLTAVPGTAMVGLSWTVPLDGGSPITGYNVYRGSTSGGETLVATVTGGTTYDDAAVTSAATYYYEVSAVNGDGEGAISTEVSATPL